MYIRRSFVSQRMRACLAVQLQPYNHDVKSRISRTTSESRRTDNNYIPGGRGVGRSFFLVDRKFPYVTRLFQYFKNNGYRRSARSRKVASCRIGGRLREYIYRYVRIYLYIYGYRAENWFSLSFVFVARMSYFPVSVFAHAATLTRTMVDRQRFVAATDIRRRRSLSPRATPCAIHFFFLTR